MSRELETQMILRALTIVLTFAMAPHAHAGFWCRATVKVDLLAPESLGTAPISTNYDKINREKIDLLNRSTPTRETSRVTGISDAFGTEIFQAIQSNPVVSTFALKTYDPDGEVGFCFGRAAAFHIEALRRGVSKDSIRKVWVTGGDFLRPRQLVKTDSHHVATAIRHENGRWMVFDPTYFAEPVSLEQWYAQLSIQNLGMGFNFFVTDPRRMIRSTSQPLFELSERAMDETKISHADRELYNRYFREYLATVRQASRKR